MPEVEAVSSSTNGFSTIARLEIGPAIWEATVSGKISASRLGTSSPMISET